MLDCCCWCWCCCCFCWCCCCCWWWPFWCIFFSFHSMIRYISIGSKIIFSLWTPFENGPNVHDTRLLLFFIILKFIILLHSSYIFHIFRFVCPGIWDRMAQYGRQYGNCFFLFGNKFCLFFVDKFCDVQIKIYKKIID